MSASITSIEGDLNELKKQIAELKLTVARLSSLQQPGEEVARRFSALTSEWKATRGHFSTDLRLAMNQAYQAIIGMGPAVVPLLLKEMEQRPSRWSWALRAITGANPVQSESRGKLNEIAAAWVQWGRANGYRW